MMTRRSRPTLLLVALALLSCGDPAGPVLNEAPTAWFASPLPGALFSGGDTVRVRVFGNDPESGTLDPAQVTWWAELHHGDHTHPFVPPTVGFGGQAVVPTVGHVETNIFFRFHGIAADSAGAADTVTVDIQPRLVSVQVESNPSGLAVLVDGQPSLTPFTIESVVGIERTLTATTPQSLGAFSWGFQSWSHGSEAEHVFVAPETDSTIVAAFRQTGVANEPPGVSFTNPLTGDTLTAGQAYVVSMNASDPDGTVVSVQLLDGSTVLGTDTVAPFDFPWTPSRVGPHTLVARATDDEALTTADTVMVSVVASGPGDVAPPVTTITAPVQGTMDLTGSILVTADATDDVGVEEVEFQIDGTWLSSDSVAPYEAQLASTADFTSGAHTFRARARDAAGNWSPWSSSTVTFGGNVTLPQGFSTTTYASGFATLVTAAAFAPDGRIFVAEVLGGIRLIPAGGGFAMPFDSVSVVLGGERGLLGIALDPDFESNGYLYVYYTSAEGGVHNRISRITANGDVAVPGSEVVLVELEALSAAENHNGGAMHFGPDGMLYVAVGDNSDTSLAPSLNSRFGKILRYNPDGSIPSDNPLVGETTGEFQAIWASGLRNPFSFAFDPSTGRMHINDVGQNTWEEINLGIPGADYGWPATEGPTENPAYTSPILAYRHSDSPTLFNGFAIVGAAFYDPPVNMFGADYFGDYFFADYVSGWVYRMDSDQWDTAYAFADYGPANVVGLMTGPDGALYVIAGGAIQRISR